MMTAWTGILLRGDYIHLQMWDKKGNRFVLLWMYVI